LPFQKVNSQYKQWVVFQLEIGHVGADKGKCLSNQELPSH
jgi:hypothetical protein